MALAAAVLFLSVTAFSQDKVPNAFQVPHTFHSGGPALASQVNENFTAIERELERHGKELGRVGSLLERQNSKPTIAVMAIEPIQLDGQLLKVEEGFAANTRRSYWVSDARKFAFVAELKSDFSSLSAHMAIVGELNKRLQTAVEKLQGNEPPTPEGRTRELLTVLADHNLMDNLVFSLAAGDLDSTMADWATQDPGMSLPPEIQVKALKDPKARLNAVIGFHPKHVRVGESLRVQVVTQRSSQLIGFGESRATIENLDRLKKLACMLFRYERTKFSKLLQKLRSELDRQQGIAAQLKSDYTTLLSKGTRLRVRVKLVNGGGHPVHLHPTAQVALVHEKKRRRFPLRPAGEELIHPKELSPQVRAFARRSGRLVGGAPSSGLVDALSHAFVTLAPHSSVQLELFTPPLSSADSDWLTKAGRASLRSKVSFASAETTSASEVVESKELEIGAWSLQKVFHRRK